MFKTYALFFVMAAAAGATVEPWFGSDVAVGDRLEELIATADYDVVCVMDRFADYDLAAAFERAARRGRRVRVVVGGDADGVGAGRALRDHLADNGVEVKTAGGALFSRFVVVDGRVVAAGSYPYLPEAAASSLTDVVIIEDEAVAARYLAFFDYVFNNAK